MSQLRPSARASSCRALLAAGVAIFATWCCSPAAPAQAAPLRGLPFSRTYPLDEIGNVPRGLRLGFDAFGRVAVMYDGVYSVLNDSAWVDRIDKSAATRGLITTIKVARGKYYYGGRGSWGTIEQTADGKFRAAPLVPADAPAWTRVTAFNKVLETSRGIYFYDINGAVYQDFASRRNFFFEMPRLTAVFALGNRVFVSCQDHLIRELQPESGTHRVVAVAGLEGQTVEYAVPLDESHALLATYDGRLVSFDGNTATPWRSLSELKITGKISALERLVDGGVAIAIDDKGIFLFSAEGQHLWSLVAPEFRRTRTMAAGEPGVLWVGGENAIHRIFYDSPLTSFGQHTGLKVAWPQLAGWNNNVLACSNRAIYLAEPGPPGRPASFRILAGGPTQLINCIAVSGPHLLAGTPAGVEAIATDGTITPLIQLENVAGLKFIQPDLCVVIGSREIAALRCTDGRWTECAPRIKGVGDAPINVAMHDYLWIEMGGDQVARVTVKDGTIDLRRISLPWKGESWTNVGMIGKTIVLTGASGQRTYYDESRDTLCEAPALDRLLRRSPYWLLRMKEDDSGVLWATHTQGIVTFTPRGDDYEVDPVSFELPNDSYPNVAILPGNDIWIATGWSLYHVEPQAPRTLKRPHMALVSLIADNHNLELLNQTGVPASPPQLSYDENSLTFRFFSGTYAWLSAPLYEYRLGPAEPWTPVDPSLALRFPKLRDGAYVLEVRPSGPRDADALTFTFPFTILPPWYRTQASFVIYAFGLILFLVMLARWINYRSLGRNVVLERLVHERTRELEVTMAKLGEETHNAATLAERSRLAGEIHDSVQQGLSGTMLHLETTMTNPTIAPDVLAQLGIMRSMLSYSREEVQHAVWNLESPLLQNSTLGQAFRKLAGYINTGSTVIQVAVHQEPPSLPPAIRHNLLRIAQEAITNAVKHAGASEIKVILRSLQDSVILDVTDDGRGFDPVTRVRVEGHFGLRGLQDRARSINARLEIISAPGAGTTIQVIVPVAPPHPQ